jgi:uncharacterized protein with NRDE domain
LGITQQGRIACLTNYHERNSAIVAGRRSRGVIVNSFLKTATDTDETNKEVAHRLITEGLAGVGGFSLIFGQLRRPNWDGLHDGPKSDWEGLGIVSNRSEQADDVEWICSQPGETHSLSNAKYGDKSWPKVVDGEQHVAKEIQEAASAGESKEKLIARFLDVLSIDTLPKQQPDEEWDSYSYKLRNSIFIPKVKKDDETVAAAQGQSPLPAKPDRSMSGGYGTQKQTVVLVDWDGNVTFVERSLFDEEGRPIARGQGDVSFTFKIEGWL